MLFASKTAMVGLFIVLFWVFVGIFAPLLTPYTPTYQDYTAQNLPPSAEHPLGTDSLGRDILSRLIFGARITLYIVALVALIAPIAGLLVGTVAGYVG